MVFGQFQSELISLHLHGTLSIFGVVLFHSEISDVLMAAAISLLLLRRLLLSVRRQRQMALDVKQAQEVQQMILPEAQMVLLVIECEYRPAREVGGDFFQVIPIKTDGSLLIVAGDVTGKGLKAGMLVALLVGAIRSTAETDAEPSNVLAALNRRLLGRGDAQATCLALRIAKDGAATLANVGHIPPYLNGEPLPMEGALPLGMIEDAEPSLMLRLARLQLTLDKVSSALRTRPSLACRSESLDPRPSRYLESPDTTFAQQLCRRPSPGRARFAAAQALL
jgi:hypothetical protein